MNNLVSLISGAPRTRGKNDDDFVDRLSSRYTVVLLITFAVFISMNQYVRNPITCWAPVHFTGPHTRFATNYCWVKNTYYLPWDEEVPKATDTGMRQMVTYYQWTPLILLLQAILFVAPSIFWHGLNSKAGVDADNILAAAHSLKKTDKVESHEKTLKMLANHMDRFLNTRQQRGGCGRGVKCILSAIFCRMFGRRLGSYLLVLFIFSKVLYIANIFSQFFLLNKVFSMKYNTFGFDMANKMASAEDWTEDQSFVAFPRVTYCDFRVRGQDMANTQSYTVQCVLPINLYIEKIYLFLWYWMAFVLGASVLGLIMWIARAVAPGDRTKFIRNHLRLGDRLTSDVDGEMVSKFTREYLRQDGAFIMRLIAHNTDNVTTTEVVCAVWDSWKENNLLSDKKRLYPNATELSTLNIRELNES